MLGFLFEQGNPAAAKYMGLELVFVALPTAFEKIDGENWWIMVLGLTLFFLGISCAYGMVEAFITVLYDMPMCSE